MIASLRGTVMHIDPPDSLVLEVAGVGYRVAVPVSVLDGADVGRPLHVHTVMIVREDALALYGFSDDEERGLFELLLTVQGVGPKVALAVLSSLAPEMLRAAIANEQAEVLSRVKGIGRRTAEKIVFTLRDKLGRGPGLAEVTSAADIDGDLIAALTALGYSAVEAQSAVQSLPKESRAAPLEDRLRQTLAALAS
jgi:Holliday junction DNA helicase RuvA